jgi:hypothetical protein
VTIADAGSAPALALGAAALTSITVNLENSIVLGTKPASGGGITVNESNDDNDGSVGHRTALFVDPANENFLLRVGSVAIDQGGGPSGGESTEDVEGQVRTGTWDRGADEFVNHQPAAPGLIADRVSATPGQQVNFAAIAGPQPDADRGDGVAKFRFDFGDGSGVVEQASGAASHTYAAAGQYAVTAKTVDIPGSASDPSNVVTITVAAAGGNGGGGPGGGGGGLPGGGSSGPDLAPPFLSITSPRAGQRLKRGKRAPVLRGRTSDATGVRTVELALRRLEGRRCRWYDTRRRTFVVGGCTTPRFFRAVVNDFGWSYTFPRNVLPPLGRYELRARATDFLGHRTTALTSAARTLVAFRIVP